MSARSVVPDGPARRWWHGGGDVCPPEAESLLRRGRGRVCRLDAAGRLAGEGVDQVEAEQLLWAALDAGLVEIHERRDRRGDWVPYQWRLSAAGEARFADTADPLPGEVATWLLTPEESPTHPVLANLREWLAGPAWTEMAPNAVRLALAIGTELRAGRVPRGRIVSLGAAGHTKAVRVDDHREVLAAALGFPVEEVVRQHGRAALAWGDFEIGVGERTLDGRWSVPWLALTENTLDEMGSLRTPCRRVVTIENLTNFECYVEDAPPFPVIAVFTGGFPSALERRLLLRLIEAGVQTIDHWGDLDVGGIRILRHLRDTLPVPVRPWRMEPELLEVLPTQPLTPRDRDALVAWVADESAPAQDLAAAMLCTGRKAEQEGWYLRGLARTRREPASGG